MLNLPFSRLLNQLATKYLTVDTSDPENYPAATRLLGEYLSLQDFDVMYKDIPEAIAGGPYRSNLIARRHVHNQLPTLLIYNHVDVVPADYDTAFTPSLKEGKLYARGAADHKGGTLSILAALEKLSVNDLKYNLVFIATTDEETGQSPQLDYLFNHLDLPSNSILFDTDTYAGGITIARLGRLNLKLRVYGEATHAGTSHVGKNAIEETISLVNFLNQLKTKFEKTVSAIPPMPTSKVSAVQNKLNVTMLNCGTAINVIPASCKIGVNVRFIPEADDFAEKDLLVQKLDLFCQSNNIDYDVIHSNLIAGNPTDHPAMHRLQKAHQQITGESGLYAVPISNPMIDIARKYHLPLIGLGLMRHDTNIHADNEFCYVQDMLDLQSTFKLFLIN